LGYSDVDREANIKRIILGAYLLDRNNIVGIVCNISPLEHLRLLTRRKIAGYNEIYLKKDLLSERKYAASLGISQKAVNKHRHQVLAKLRTMMKI